MAKPAALAAAAAAAMDRGSDAPPAGFLRGGGESCFLHVVGQCVARAPGPLELQSDGPVTTAFRDCAAGLLRRQQLQWPCRAVAVDGQPLRRALAATVPALGATGSGQPLPERPMC